MKAAIYIVTLFPVLVMVAMNIRQAWARHALNGHAKGA
jgi:hypothetical protein